MQGRACRSAGRAVAASVSRSSSARLCGVVG